MLPKTIVVISHNYAPLQNPRAFRWTAICEHWVRRGARVEVVTAWTPGLSRCEELNGVNVHRVGGGLIGESTKFEFVVVDGFERGASGKFKCIINNLEEAKALAGDNE